VTECDKLKKREEKEPKNNFRDKKETNIQNISSYRDLKMTNNHKATQMSENVHNMTKK